MIASVPLQPGQRVVDMPCGGGDLGARVPAGVEMIGADSSLAFARLGQAYARYPVHHAPLTSVGDAVSPVDVVISLAGLHHVADLGDMFAAMLRALRPGCRLVLVDLEQGSEPTRFLDGFADAHNPQGHVGSDVTDAWAGWLTEAGAMVEADEQVTSRWVCPSEPAMAAYLIDLFGMEATEADLLAEMERTVGRADGPDGVAHRRTLRRRRARRTG